MSHSFKIALLIAAVMLLPSTARGLDLSPSKNTAVTSSGSLLPPTSGSLAATISKGKAKSVLLIATTVQYIGSDPTSVCFTNFYANGKPVVSPTPNLGSVTCTNCAAGGCTLTSNQWVDIDAAEAQFPGEFKNQPITISVDYSSGFASGAATTMMSVTMQKK